MWQWLTNLLQPCYDYIMLKYSIRLICRKLGIQVIRHNRKILWLSTFLFPVLPVQFLKILFYKQLPYVRRSKSKLGLALFDTIGTCCGCPIPKHSIVSIVNQHPKIYLISTLTIFFPVKIRDRTYRNRIDPLLYLQVVWGSTKSSYPDHKFILQVAFYLKVTLTLKIIKKYHRL